MVREAADNGKTSYRVRYKPSNNIAKNNLAVSGYGVELALKKTDYIVIDDRDAADSGKGKQAVLGNDKVEEELVDDLRPLPASELLELASSYVMSSKSPLNELQKLTQDFPKFSHVIGSQSVSKDFMVEHKNNREVLVPPGYNVIWINGVQIESRQVDPFTLLNHLRRERTLIHGFRQLGLTGPEAIGLLSHTAISESISNDEPQRYDFRDDIEANGVIIWLNDIEKDKRYSGWPTNVEAVC
jgi:UDP-glucose:glycoprotein glucosyltransferase